MLFHQTKDVVYVKNFLDHKRIENTLLYIQLAEMIFKDASNQFISSRQNLEGSSIADRSWLRIRHRHGWGQNIPKAKVAGERQPKH